MQLSGTFLSCEAVISFQLKVSPELLSLLFDKLHVVFVGIVFYTVSQQFHLGCQ